VQHRLAGGSGWLTPAGHRTLTRLPSANRSDAKLDLQRFADLAARKAQPRHFTTVQGEVK
jgi:hypothetical protein